MTHVAVVTAQEKAQRRLAKADKRAAAVEERRKQAKALLSATAKEHRAAAREHLSHAEAEVRRAAKDLQAAKDEAQRLATTPREVYVRDTTRDAIVTCLKMTVLMLIEYVLKEYFGGLRMEARSFLEDYLWLPVTVRKTSRSIIYSIEGNTRSPEKLKHLRSACEEATRRGIKLDGRRLRFEVIDPSGPNGQSRLIV